VLDALSVLVKPDVAARQIEEEQGAAVVEVSGEEAVDVGSAEGAGPTGTGVAATAKLPNRFYGSVSLEPVRMLRDLGEIADAIVAQLGRAGAAFAITVEINAIAAKGFPDDVRRTVSDNARTLKFTTHEFEDG